MVSFFLHPAFIINHLRPVTVLYIPTSCLFTLAVFAGRLTRGASVEARSGRSLACEESGSVKQTPLMLLLAM